MAANAIDLFSLFNQVSKTMKKSQTSLNKADTYNHDHGDHMVEIFEVITQSMKEKKNADPADQLEYAADLLRGKAASGSGKLYAEGLTNAAKQMVGKDLNAGSVMSMLQTVMGVGQKPAEKPAAGGGILGSLLGSLTGGGDQDSGVDLGDLLGAFTGGAAEDNKGGLDLGDLVGAGMSLLAATQGDDNKLESLAGALLSGSQMESSPYRKESSQLVTSTVLKALTSMLTK